MNSTDLARRVQDTSVDSARAKYDVARELAVRKLVLATAVFSNAMSDAQSDYDAAVVAAENKFYDTRYDLE